MIMQMFREYIKDIPYDSIIQLTQKEFPHLASPAIQGDKLAMSKLSTSFMNKATEYLGAGNMQTAITYGASGVFWKDKTKNKNDKGFTCPNCGSTNTWTTYMEHPDCSILKGQSLCNSCEHQWRINL